MPSIDFERYFDLAPDVLCITDTTGHLLHTNAAGERAFGSSNTALQGRLFVDLIHPDDTAATRRDLAKLAAGIAPLIFVTRSRTASGLSRSLEWNATYDAQTEQIYLLGRDLSSDDSNQAAIRTAQDHEKAIMQALRLSESRLAEAQQMAMIGSWESDRITESLWWSDEVYRIFEVDPAQQPSLSDAFWERVYPEDRAIVRKTLLDSVAQQIPYNLMHRLQMPDGRIKYVLEQARTLYDIQGTPLHTIGTVQDVTAWKGTDSALALAKARFEAALEGVVAGFFILDTEWRYYFVNSVGAHMVNRTREQLQGKVIWEEFPEAVGTIFYTTYHQVMETRQPQIIHEHYAALDVWFEVYVFPYVGGISIFFLDTTKRKRAEQALELKNQAIASAVNAIVIANAAGEFVYVNPAFLRMWGYTAEHEVLGRSSTNFADPAAINGILDQLATNGTWQGETMAIRKDGSTFDAMISANAVYNANGTISHLVSSILDVSDAKRLQAQFLQAQKMESVGRLAGGIAHDFNNLLTVMKGYVDLALQSLEADDLLTYDLRQVDQAIDSAASLTQQLLTFSRRQIIAPQVINLNDVILRAQKMLHRLLGEDVDLRLALKEPLAPVLFDPNQCEQIVINLAINARDAMPHGGTLIIETTEVNLDANYIRLHTDIPPGHYVLLAISDTGTGMSAEVQAHLFEPFFTTKEVGKGTGLGLAMIYGAVSQNGGRIEVYSELEQGTTFKIYLPCVDDPSIASQPVPVATLPHGKQTLMLVEDDEQVRLLTVRLLEQQGYRVYAFPNGASALQAVSTIPTDIDLLITDVIMPGMNGRVLADYLREIFPALKVLFTSGYTTNVIVHHGVLKEGVPFLPKPYSGLALAERVHEVLNGP